MEWKEINLERQNATRLRSRIKEPDHYWGPRLGGTYPLLVTPNKDAKNLRDKAAKKLMAQSGFVCPPLSGLAPDFHEIPVSSEAMGRK